MGKLLEVTDIDGRGKMTLGVGFLALEGSASITSFQGRWFHVLCQHRSADCKKTKSHCMDIQNLLEKEINLLKILTL